MVQKRMKKKNEILVQINLSQIYKINSVDSIGLTVMKKKNGNY